MAPASDIKRRFLLLFLGCFFLLILSEYFLLAEMYRERRLPVMVASAVLLAGSIFAFWRLYRRLQKTTAAAGRA